MENQNQATGNTGAGTPFFDGENATSTVKGESVSTRYHFEMIGALSTVLQEAWKRQEEGDRANEARQAYSVREYAHGKGECHSELNGRQPIFALLGYDDIRNLEGKLLTIVDASFQDREQRRAVKSLVRRAIWFEWVKHLDTDDVHVGMPNLT